jgi:CMP-N,N'-diacetyllegionaminic acid synthase
MSFLVLIPARGGSKGIPGKNYKSLGSKSLIQYTMEVARALTIDENICVSTDDQTIIDCVAALGYTVPFIRPAELASDTAGSYEVMLHAIQFYEQQGKLYDKLVLLQPTSPFRTVEQVKEAMALYTPSLDMVVSVKETKANPYYLLMEENNEGFLQKCKEANYARRQEIPKVYELNGAIYIINIGSVKKYKLSSFRYIRKYVMDEISSIDLDTPIDWLIAETLLNNGLVNP